MFDKFLLLLSFFLVTSCLNVKDSKISDKMIKKEREVILEYKESAIEINNLRSSLASSFITDDVEVTKETFKSVCGEVKKRTMEIAKEKKYKIMIRTEKYRNEMNKATKEDKKFLKFFNYKSERKELFVEGQNGKLFYISPVYVEKPCLACHGEKDKRPDFIKKKYPNDLAYGYKVDDLRAIMIITKKGQVK